MRGRHVTALALVVSIACGGPKGEVVDDVTTHWVERVAKPTQTGGGPPPLLVLLHGIGADENDLFPLAHDLDPRLEIVSLRAPHRYTVGYAWFAIDFRPGGELVPDVVQARTTLADLMRWLDAAPARLGTDPHRTFLLGFSQGAMMALGVLRSRPERLAGVIALSGRPPAGLFDAPAPDDAVARVPVLVAHGTYDDLLPIANGRAVRDTLQPVVRDLTYQEFPIAHAVSDAEVALVGRWLEARVGDASAKSH